LISIPQVQLVISMAGLNAFTFNTRSVCSSFQSLSLTGIFTKSNKWRRIRAQCRCIQRFDSIYQPIESVVVTHSLNMKNISNLKQAGFFTTAIHLHKVFQLLKNFSAEIVHPAGTWGICIPVS